MKYFPPVQFSTAKGITAVLDHEKLHLSDWDAPVAFAGIAKCQKEQHLGGERLVIEYQAEGAAKKQNRKINFNDLKGTGAGFLETFEKYYGRHLTAKLYNEQKGAPARPAGQ